MSLISILVVLIVVGFLLWLVTTYIPMETTIKRIVVAVAVIGIVLYLLVAFGVWDDVRAVKVPR